MISTLDQMVEKVLDSGKRHRIAVSWAQDSNTITAIYKAVASGFVEAILIGRTNEIKNICKISSIDPNRFIIVHSEDEQQASAEAVRLAKEDEADIVMKGLVGTDVFLKAVMDRKNGIVNQGEVLTYVGAIEIPRYRKLLFITDPAVIPYPNLEQKMAMAGYAVEMTSMFGIKNPKIALIGASEKNSHHFHYTDDYSEMLRRSADGKTGDCIMEGPLDLFLACDPESSEIKRVRTRIAGDADILLFPSLESSNPFYKSLMLFGDGKLAGLIRGTQKPVIVMSRSESEKSKYYCIALSCLMAIK
jgi:phosphate butyryltransferase